MEPQRFKFKWVQNGEPTGFRSKQGLLDGENLHLDDITIPIGAIHSVEIRQNYMIFVVPDETGQERGLVIMLTGGSINKLKTALDHSRSGVWAESRRQELIAQGRGSEFRSAVCPNCQATVDLAGMDKTPQVYCRFCDSLLTDPAFGLGPKNEAAFRICESCQMFSAPRQYSIFYFYFLLVVYGWSSRQVWCCPMCFRPEAWKMLLGNAPFVLGVIPATVQLTRAYSSDKLGGEFSGLHKANALAIKGNFAGAIEGYQAILQRAPHSAGIHYNLGMALARRDELPRAAEAFKLALTDCANYLPAAEALSAVYHQLGWTDQLQELQQTWNGPGGAPLDDAVEPAPVEGMPAPKQLPPEGPAPGSPFAL